MVISLQTLVISILLGVGGTLLLCWIIFALYWEKPNPKLHKLLSKDTDTLRERFLENGLDLLLPETECEENKCHSDLALGCKIYLMKDLTLGRHIESRSFAWIHRITINKEADSGEMVVAGKIIDETKGLTTEAFLREVNMLRLTSEKSPYIVKIVGIVMVPKIILMEYYSNGSLDHVLFDDYNLHGGDDGAEFPIIIRLRFILQLCNAVCHLHRHNIVHRDIATRNLLLSDNRDKVVLSNFSLARKADDVFGEGNVTYTAEIPKTSPPETLGDKEQKLFGLKTDIWGVGVTMIEIVNKRTLMDKNWELKSIGGTKALRPKKLVRDDITIGENFAREVELWGLMLRCWRLNPEDRPQIWEVKDRVQDLLTFPLVFNKANCYIDRFAEQDKEEYGLLSDWNSNSGSEEARILSCWDMDLGESVCSFLSPETGKSVSTNEVKFDRL
jgi:serine/threonine protein kinase